MRFNPLKPDQAARPPRPTPLPKGTIPNPAPISGTPVLTENEAKDGLELRFPKKPTPEVLDLFHATKTLPQEHRWYFHFRGKFWYARRNDVTRALAQKIVGAAPVPAPTPAPITNIVPVNFAPLVQALTDIKTATAAAVAPASSWRSPWLNRR